MSNMKDALLEEQQQTNEELDAMYWMSKAYKKNKMELTTEEKQWLRYIINSQKHIDLMGTNWLESEARNKVYTLMEKLGL